MRFTDDTVVLVRALLIFAQRSRTLGYSALQRMAPTVFTVYTVPKRTGLPGTAVTLTVP